MGKEMLHPRFVKVLIYFSLSIIKREVKLLLENLPPILQGMCRESVIWGSHDNSTLNLLWDLSLTCEVYSWDYSTDSTSIVIIFFWEILKISSKQWTNLTFINPSSLNSNWLKIMCLFLTKKKKNLGNMFSDAVINNYMYSAFAYMFLYVCIRVHVEATDRVSG